MKKLSLLAFCLILQSVIFNLQSFAQAPKLMNYQGVVRDANGQTLVNKTVNLRLSILSAADITDAIYKEEQSVTTTEFGLFAIKIGEGSPIKGSMADIDWSSADHFIAVELDAENNGHFQFMGTSQLLSVPYAFYAEKSGTAKDLENMDNLRTIDFGGTFGQTIRHNGTDWVPTSNLHSTASRVGIGTTSPVSKLDVNGDINISSGSIITVGEVKALEMDEARNFMMGRQSGDGITTGENNNFIGDKVASGNTTGSNNNMIGYRAGFSNTTGDANILYGYKAGYSNTTGSNNSFIGLHAGYNSVGSQNNIAIGTKAGENLADGKDNTFVGRQAGQNTTADRNAFIGKDAGISNTTGSDNTYIGYNADGIGTLENATAIGANTSVTASNSVVLGNDANVGIGTSAPVDKLHVRDGILRIDSGRIEFRNTGYSVFIGEDAGMSSNFEEDYNIYIGYKSGQYDSADGDLNTAVGGYALSENVSGRKNSAFGYGAMWNSTGGDDNVAIGRQSMQNVINSSENTAVGVYSLRSLGGGIGSRNTAIGYAAGWGYSGSKSVLIGYEAGKNRSGDNKLFIDNTNTGAPLIYGEFDNDLLAFNANVGIGTTTPEDKLHVVGNIRMTDGNQAAGYIMTSDANGTASWQATVANSSFDTLGGVVMPGSAVDETADDFVFGSTQLDDDGNSNHDRRFFFDKSKGAFRAGQATGPRWNTDSIGSNSVAMGTNTKALGGSSVALGANTKAEGAYAVALGNGTKATVGSAFASGKNTTASGLVSTAMGENTIAFGEASIATGYESTAFGYTSTATGYRAAASGEFSTAIGSNTLALRDYSTAIGRSTKAIGESSTAIGRSANAGGENSVAIGHQSSASGLNATAIGRSTSASGEYSTAMGRSTTASGNNSTAAGYDTEAPSAYETSIGVYNAAYTPLSTTGWEASDRLFSIGNGTSDTSRSDALVLLKNGNFGLGTSTPDTTFHLVGKMKYQDGTQFNGYVLTSDADGNASWQASAGGSADTLTIIADADNDTKIEVEQSADADLIHFSMGGTEYFRMDSGLLHVLNSGHSVFMGQDAGINDDFSDNRNVGIGLNALRDNTTGRWNTALGASALSQNTTAQQNVAVGFAAASQQTGDNNIAIGAYARLFADGDRTIAIGSQSGKNSGSGNIFLGDSAGFAETGDNRLYIENSAADSANALIYGEFDNNILAINGELWSTGNFGAGVANPNLDLSIGHANTGLQNNGSNSLQLYTSGVERVRFQSNGNVGVGTTSPSQKLDVSGNVNVSDATYTNNLEVGGGGLITSVVTHSEELNINSINGNDAETVTFSVSGAEVGGVVYISPRQDMGGQMVIAQCWVSSADTVSMRVRNAESGAQNPPNMFYDIVVINF